MNVHQVGTRTQLQLNPKLISRGKLIDDGGFGTVYEGVLTMEGRPIPVAIKQMKGRNVVNDMLKELETLRSLNHTNVMKCYGLVADDNAVDLSNVHIGCCLVFELCPLGSLRNALDACYDIKEGESAGSGGGWEKYPASISIAAWDVRSKVFF